MISLTRIRDRKLVQWAMAYLAGAWLTLQVCDVIGDRFGWPDAWLRVLIAVLGVGFIAAVIVAWYHGERGAQRVSGPELVMLTILLVIGGAAVALVAGDEPEAQPAVHSLNGPPQAVAVPTDQASIAVLPFDNTSSDPEQEYFSDGLTEELMNALAQTPGLRVAALTSAFAFKGQDVAVDSIGRALHVAWVVEGSVRKEGNRLRITAQLVDAASGFQRWSRLYVRDLADVFAVQDEISRAIVGELRLRVGARAQSTVSETSNPEAHALLLRAIQTWQQGTGKAGFAEVERLLRAALARDPSYARAHSRLALLHVYQAAYRTIPPEDGYRRAREEAGRALALDSSQVEAYTALGMAGDQNRWDFAASEAYYRRALEINPNDVSALQNHAINLVQMGRKEEAIRQAQRAVLVDPLSAGALNDLGLVYSLSGQFEQAIEQYRLGLALTPGASWLLDGLSWALAYAGRAEEAIEVSARSLAADSSDPFGLVAAAFAQARAGHRTVAARLLAALPEDEYYLRATVAAGLGDVDDAFALLERAVARREDGVRYLGADPAFDSLRSDPRMDRLLRRIGLR